MTELLLPSRDGIGFSLRDGLTFPSGFETSRIGSNSLGSVRRFSIWTPDGLAGSSRIPSGLTIPKSSTLPLPEGPQESPAPTIRP